MKKICSNICLFVRDTFKPITYAYDIGWKIFVLLTGLRIVIFFFFFIFVSFYIYIRDGNISKASIFRSKSGLLIYNRERIESLSVSLALAFHLVLRSRFSFESRLGISIPLFSRLSFASTANETWIKFWYSGYE